MDFFTSLNFSQVNKNSPLFSGESLQMSQLFAFKSQQNPMFISHINQETDEKIELQSPETNVQMNFQDLSQSLKFWFNKMEQFNPKEMENQENQTQLDNFVMEQQQWIESIGKTNNMARYILRCIKKYYNQDLYQVIKRNEPVPLRIKEFFDRFRSRNKLPSLTVLQKLLNRSHNTQGDPLLNRKIIAIILRKRAKKQIIENNRIKTKKLHMVSSKIYRLRCQSSELVGRSCWK